MVISYSNRLKEYARKQRKSGNLSEALLWNQIKNKQIKDSKFYRQKCIGNYIVDFYCPKRKLVLEIDGESHEFKVDYDTKRDEYLKSLDLKVIHIDDMDIKKNLEEVLLMLEMYLR
ncbi:MAG: DUF559 domain-containing protein [Rickettsiales bacterium]|jgi:very-short-patch-repair endonuclease|nr:DUF559 domain-containing protein [Rickettsiales bacterium]